MRKGFTAAVSFTKGNAVGANCYCYGQCSGNVSLSNCCSGSTSRPFILTVTCL